MSPAEADRGSAAPGGTGYEPPRPTLVAIGLLSIWVLLLSLPMAKGQFLASEFSDQYATGYAFRHWFAEQWKALGHVPLWNPMIFGGLPFVAAQHGDIFYPTAWLRLFLPTDVAMNLGFALHYVLAGVFTYALLRLFRVSWLGSVVGGVAYQLSGVIASLVSPGHDGKLFVSTLLPLTLIGLVLGIERRRFEGYPLVALAVGLALLSPHYQMAYYLLIAAGLFALYLTVGHRPASVREPAQGLGLALAAVLLGFGIALIQVLPFYHYIGYSPRAEGFQGGFAGSTSFAIPWGHVPEFVLAGFAGDRASYWGANFLKFHSEYLGLPVVGLAILGAAGTRRRLAAWLGGIGLLFLLISLGAGTPFYRVWWTLMPFVKQTRAPGMAFFVVAFVIAVFAGLGAERVERREGRRHVVAWAWGGAVVAGLALAGVFGGLAEFLAQGVELRTGRPVAAVAAAAAPGIGAGAMWSGLALVGVALLVLAGQRAWIPRWAVALALPLVIGADLWRNAGPFWQYTDAGELYGPDPVVEAIAAGGSPARVLNLVGSAAEVYPGSSLMAAGIPQLLGHHGNELHAFDELLGGKNVWQHLLHPNVWDLYAIGYVLLPTGRTGVDSLPGFERDLSGVETITGVPADLFRRASGAGYARFVTAAMKAPDEQTVATVLDARFSPDRLVLLGPETPGEFPEVTSLPAASEVSVTTEAWEPGRIGLRLAPASPEPGYVVVAENWYPDWRATADGSDAPVARGNMSLIVVPVPEGTSTVTLTFNSPDYRLGRVLSWMSLAAVFLGLAVPTVRRRGVGV